LGPKRNHSLLHSKLNTLLNTGAIPEPEAEEASALTDNESDTEQTEEVTDFEDESTEPTED